MVSRSPSRRHCEHIDEVAERDEVVVVSSSSGAEETPTAVLIASLVRCVFFNLEREREKEGKKRKAEKKQNGASSE